MTNKQLALALVTTVVWGACIGAGFVLLLLALSVMFR